MANTLSSCPHAWLISRLLPDTYLYIVNFPFGIGFTLAVWYNLWNRDTRIPLDGIVSSSLVHEQRGDGKKKVFLAFLTHPWRVKYSPRCERTHRMYFGVKQS